MEVTAYYIVSEALTNAAKRANATAVHDPARGSGLLGLHDRVEAADGTITIHSPIGGGQNSWWSSRCDPYRCRTEVTS